MSVPIESAKELVQVLKASQKHSAFVIIKFYFPWCPHCQKIEADYESMAEHNDADVFLSVDMDEHPDIAKALHISAGPTFLVISRGMEKYRLEGTDMAALQTFIRKQK